MTIALIGIVLGEITALFDLGTRLVGTYIRTFSGAALRILIILSVCILFATPPYLVAFYPQWRPAYVLTHIGGFLGYLSFLHYVFPYRFGIRKLKRRPVASPVRLARGVVLREEAVEIECAHPSPGVLRCLLISDLHCNGRRKLALVHETVSALVDLDATTDFVFVLGDLTDKNEFVPELMAALASPRSRYGTFCVRGNHDYQHGRGQMILELAEQHSMTVLSNKAYRVPETDITLVGLEAPWRPPPELPAVTSSSAIGLTHTPDNIHRFAKLGVQVAVAGHTHAGEFSFPLIGPVCVPSGYGRFLDRGWFRSGDTRLFITRGIGCFPGGLGAPGEVVHLEIKRQPQNSLPEACHPP